MFHYQLTYDVTWYFLSTQAIKLLFDLFNCIFNFAYWQGTLLTSFTNTNIELLPVKIFSPLVALDYHQVKFLDPLLCTEASFAMFTFAPAMYGITNITRIFYARFGSAT